MFTSENLNRTGKISRRGMTVTFGHRWRHLAYTGALSVLCVATATAQVRQVQGGNALDANPMVGSGGYNGARPVTSGINGNLIISGNVTGGRAFQGFSPITNPSSLQTTIPSANLSNFIRDSAGLPSIQGGLSPYAARPYFDPSQTVVTTGAIEVGTLLARDVGGTYRVGQGQYQMPVAPLSGTQPISQYAGQLPYAAPGWTPAGIGMFNPDIVATTPGQISSNPLTAYTVSGPLAVSEVSKPPTETGARPNQPGQPEEQGQPGEPTQLTGPNVLPPDTSVTLTRPNPDKQPTAGALGPPQPASGLRNTEQTSSSLLTQMQQYSRTLQQAVPPGSEQPQGQPQQQPQQQPLAQQQQQPLDLSVDAAARRPTDELRLLRPGTTEAQRQRMRMDIGREQASRLVEQRMRTPIRSLAGARQTQVDQMLAQAEDLMHKGEYYRAAGVYDGVITAAPDNALAWLGRADALLAAGEYVQAYVALERGISRFPQVLAFDLDLPALVGNREILDIRRAELEKILTNNPDYRMQFLLGYLDYYSGQRALGLQVIRQAAGAAPAGSVVPQASLILERQAGPASQPARAG